MKIGVLNPEHLSSILEFKLTCGKGHTALYEPSLIKYTTKRTINSAANAFRLQQELWKLLDDKPDIVKTARRWISKAVNITKKYGDNSYLCMRVKQFVPSNDIIKDYRRCRYHIERLANTPLCVR